MKKEKVVDELNSTIDEIETLEEMNYAPEVLDEEYKAVNQLYVPEEARAKYAELGYDLHWIRIYVPNSQGQLDLKNIQKKESDLYDFVPRSEIPGLKKTMSSYFGDKITEGDHGLYIVGDLALAKFPFARRAAKRRFLDERIKSRSKALISDLRKNSLMPDSKSGEKFETIREQPKSREVEFG